MTREAYIARGYIDMMRMQSYRISDCPFADGWRRSAWQEGAWRWICEQRQVRS